ncbi:MAG: dockerin type I domain-containing protein, partial [Eubacterium sp.]|nr:dockerin type I domain-containing protein [Eubacterium sp.]
VTPILATPIIRRSTSASGPSGSNVHDCSSSGIGDYRQTLIDLGTKFGLSVIDNTYNTYMECITLGAGDCTISDDKTSCELTGYAAYHSVQSTGIDNTHVGPSGARMIAYFMGQTIKGNDIEFGVTGDGSSTITPILTNSSADNGNVFASIATFFGEDANTDPRTGEYNDDTEDDDSFKIYMNYDGDASKLYTGDSFSVDVCAANVDASAGIGSVTITFTYNTEEVTIGSGDLTDSAGNIVITADDFASAVSAMTSNGVYNTITLTAAYTTAVTADGVLFSVPFTLNKRGEVAITTDSVSATDAAGTVYESVATQEFVVNADSDINESDGLVITPTLTANEDGTYTLDYVLSGNTSELGISAITIYVDYDPSVVMVTGANDTAAVSSVDGTGAVLEYLMPYATVTQQIALVPAAGDEDYADAAAGPADGTKTAAQLGRIRLANYLNDADGDGTNDSAYNNGVIFSLVLTAVSAATEAEVAAAVSTGTPSAGAFGNASGEEIDVTIEGNVSDSEEEGLRGDVDNNGIITANDAACLLVYVLNNENLNPNWVVTEYVADVTGDGAYNADDVAQIMSKVLDASYVFTADAA